MSTLRPNYSQEVFRLAQKVADDLGKKISVRWYASEKNKFEIVNEGGWTIFEGTPRESWIFLRGMTYFGPVDAVEELQNRCERAVALAPDFWE